MELEPLRQYGKTKRYPESQQRRRLMLTLSVCAIIFCIVILPAIISWVGSTILQ
jgi:hypothetical protein